MNLNFIRYFLAVVETNSFTKAAERVHVTQPTLSAGIARLEEMAGAPLLRRGRQAQLTEAGMRLLPHARAIVEEMRQMRASPKRANRVSLRVGFLPTLPAASLAGLAGAFQAQAPEIELLLHPLGRGRNGVYDLQRCDAALALAEGAITGATILREPYLLAVARNHKLATRDRCSVHDLADLPFVVRRHCEVSDRATQAFADLGVRPPVRLRTGDDHLAAQVIAAELGVAFMPRSLISADLASVAIAELPWERRIVVCAGDRAPPQAADFLRFAASHDWGAGEWRLAH